MESRKVTETAYFVQITRNEILLRKILGEEADPLRMRNGGEETHDRCEHHFRHFRIGKRKNGS